MMTCIDQSKLFRVWIAEFEAWQPAAWYDVPPRATALEPACPECLTAAQAALFLQGFNEAMLADLRQLWAVAVPVEVCLSGDLSSGEAVHDVERLLSAGLDASTAETV